MIQKMWLWVKSEISASTATISICTTLARCDMRSGRACSRR